MITKAMLILLFPYIDKLVIITVKVSRTNGIYSKYIHKGILIDITQWWPRANNNLESIKLEIHNAKGIYNLTLYADEELFKIKSCNDTARIMFKLEHDLA